MRIDVHIKNGRTTFRFEKRGHLAQVLNAKPDNEKGSVQAAVRDTPKEDWRLIGVRSINASAISHVVEVDATAEIEAAAAAAMEPEQTPVTA